MDRYRFTAGGRLHLWSTFDKDRDTVVKYISSLVGSSSTAAIELYEDEFRPSDDLAVVALTAILEKAVIRGCPTLVDHDCEAALVDACKTLEAKNLEATDAPREVGHKFIKSTVRADVVFAAGRRLLASTAAPELAAHACDRIYDTPYADQASAEERLFHSGFVSHFGPEAGACLQVQPLITDLIGRDDDSVIAARTDFAFKAGPVRLVIEVDGREHIHEQRRDNERDSVLKEHGWKVVRVSTDVVRGDLDRWFGRLEDHIGAEDAKFIREFGSSQDLIETDAFHAADLLIVRPHLVHRALAALVRLVGFGIIESRADRPVRVLCLDEDLPVLAESVRQLVVMWKHAETLSPELPGAPMFELDVIAGASRFHDISIPHEGIRTRQIESADGSYDLAISHSSSLYEGQVGVLEEAARKSASCSTFVRIRSSLDARDRRHLPWSHRVHYDLRDLELALASRGTKHPLPIPEPKYEALRYFLRLVFRKFDFWDGQARVIARLLRGESAAVLLPTGGGKSLTYQFSGMMLPGVTLVVDPLVALIEDQVSNVQSLGIDRVGAISSLQDRHEKGEVMADLEEGRLFYIFVSPERLQMPEFRQGLRSLTGTTPISLAVIDEAHCVSEWGHDFRPSYLHMGHNIRKYCARPGEDPPVLVGLTGTASFAVLTDVQLELGIKEEEAVILPQSFDRKELSFEVRECEARDRESTLRVVKRQLPVELGQNPQTFYEANRGRNTNGGIIFCPWANGRLGVQMVAKDQGHQNYFSGKKPKYFPGDSGAWEDHKIRTQRDFKSDKIQELVATKSFGMGIDKPNIRYTIHYGIPQSVEAFYQEAGRAGRNGQAGYAKCYVVYADDNYDLALELLDDPDHSRSLARLNSVSQRDKGDLLVQLFFLLTSYRDRTAEKAATFDFWKQRLAPTVAERAPGSTNTIEVAFGSDRAEKETAIFRLVTLGVVKDYEVDWKNRAFQVTAVRVEPSDVVQSLRRYFRQYQFDNRVDKWIEDLEEDSLEATLQDGISRMIDFVYDVVAAKRKQALRTMAEICRSFKGDQSFREAILAYLQESEFTPILRKWINKSLDEIGLDVIQEVLDGLDSLEEAKKLVGTTRRMLDEDPGNIALRYLSVRARMRSQAEGDDSVQSEIAALVSRLDDVEAEPVVMDLMVSVIAAIRKERPAISTRVVPALLKAIGSAHLVRSYIKNEGALPDEAAIKYPMVALLAADAARTVHELEFHKNLPRNGAKTFTVKQNGRN